MALITPSSPLAPYGPDGPVEVVRQPHHEGRGLRGVWNYYVRDKWCRWAVLGAAADNEVSRVAKWLRWGAHPDMRFILGQYPHDTLVSFSINSSDEALLRVALTAGADPNLPTGSRRESPLCQALRLCKDELAKVLLENGASWRSAGLSDSNEWVTAACWIETEEMQDSFQAHLRLERSSKLEASWHGAPTPAPSPRSRF